MDEDELRTLARKRLKEKRDFHYYLWIWLAVSIVLTVVWFLTSPTTYFWPAWAIAGMGIGALFQGINVYGRRITTEADVDREVERLKGKGGNTFKATEF